MTSVGFAREQRALGSGQRHFIAQPDDLAELQAVIEQIRNVPRAATASMPDMFHHLRRCAGRLVLVAARLEIVALEQKRLPPVRIPNRPAVDARRVAEGVFGKAPASRSTTRTITTRKGKSVRVEERRSSAQMELGL